MSTKIRPRIDEMFLWKIKRAYPTETSTIKSMEKTIEFALHKALEYAKVVQFERERGEENV